VSTPHFCIIDPRQGNLADVKAGPRVRLSAITLPGTFQSAKLIMKSLSIPVRKPSSWLARGHNKKNDRSRFFYCVVI